MNSAMIRPVALRFFAAAAVLMLAAAPLPAQDTGIALGAPAPNARLHTLEGKPVELASFYGKRPVLIEFWATWCPLCKQLEPAMATARDKYGKEVEFIGITVPQNQTPDKAREFVEARAMKGTYLFDTDGAAYKAFTAPHTSYVVIIDRAGKVTYTGVGGKQDLEAALARLQ